MQVIAELTVRMARENPRWGYTRIQGALLNVGHRAGRTTIANVVETNGIDPAPERGKRTTWSQFLEAHWDLLDEKRFLILDRDSKFSSAFRNLLVDAGVEAVRLPYRSPNLNAYAERNHLGLDNRLIEPSGRAGSTSLPVKCAQRLGGMLRFYHRAAA